MLNLYSTTYAIGIQYYTFYFRTGGNYAWFKGGSPSYNQFDPGAGGTVQMVLDYNSRLGIATSTPYETVDVNGNLRVRSSNVMKFGGTGSADSKFGIQYNSSEECLDFVYLG